MSDPADGLRVVLCTAPPDGAVALAKALVERRLVACVNVVPGLRSIYRWQGEVCDDAESLLVIKTTAAGMELLRAAIHELHPYEVPELVALPIEPSEGNPAYLRWLVEQVG